MPVREYRIFFFTGLGLFLLRLRFDLIPEKKRYPTIYHRAVRRLTDIRIFAILVPSFILRIVCLA